MNNSETLNILREELTKNASETVRESAKRFFKEDVKHYGLRNGDVNKIASKYFKEIKTCPKKDIYNLCEELWKSGYMEEALMACAWSFGIRKKMEEQDLALFEKWIDKYVSNWATCDTFCCKAVGTYFLMYPHQIGILKKWSKSKNRWMRRAAAVSLILAARKGIYIKESLAIAELLLTDEDDMVQKGYGWLLKNQSETHTQIVFDFVMKHKSKMPRTALRYAIEKMPANKKKMAMLK
ncbi:MAG: DNA alkylation repair protein [Sphingobacteriaceae bacterium]|nr:DNA alkylation repair protein [Sphingobacteriaceae bacterium]